MKTTEKPVDVGAARASLESAKSFVRQTLSELEELRARRAQIIAGIAALMDKPAPWSETVDQAVAAAIDGNAATYLPALVRHIRTNNPHLARRAGYDDLPFLRLPDLNALDSTSSAAQCFFFGDVLKERLRKSLMTFDAPHADAECIGARDREAQRAELDEKLRATDAEIARLQGELDQLKGI